MPAANDIRKGQVIKFNGEPHLVMETQHRTPGNLRAFVQIKMRNLRYGKALDQRFASTDTIEVLPTDRRTLEFSYADRDSFAFIDPDTFDQIELSPSTLGDVKHYLTAGGKVEVLFVDEKPADGGTALHSCPEDHRVRRWRERRHRQQRPESPPNSKPASSSRSRSSSRKARSSRSAPPTAATWVASEQALFNQSPRFHLAGFFVSVFLGPEIRARSDRKIYAVNATTAAL
jgi:translation elongation factor P/translation initiation factor 5A